MKVICIDNKPLPNRTNKLLHLLIEGETYTVAEIKKTKRLNGESGLGYRLIEFNQIQSQNKECFSTQRFIPLSEIDEMELINNKEFQNQ